MAGTVLVMAGAAAGTWAAGVDEHAATLIGDPTEGALVALAAKGGIDAVSTRQAYPRIAELPFDAEYKLMATFHRMTGEPGKAVVRCFVRGAPDQLLARAATMLDPDAGPAPLDGRLRELYLAENQRLGEQSLRVMATARRDLDPATFDPGAGLLPLVTGPALLALIGIVDPPRRAARASIAQAKSAGIRIRMTTGDHAVTAAAIARQLGIDGTVISGAQFEAMSDDEAMDAIGDVGVIARVSPEHKVRLVDVLITWLALAGLLIATGTLSVISWAEHEHTLTIARTMGVVTFSLLNLFFSIEAKDERQSAFSLDTFSDRTFIITTGVSFLLLVTSTVLRPFQAILKTTTLDVRQWLLCTAVALSIIAAAETRKAVRRAAAPEVTTAGQSVPRPGP